MEDVYEGQLHIAAPMDRCTVVKAHEGEVVMISILLDAGLQRYSAKVTRMDLTTIPLMVVGSFKDLGLLQRRRHDRLEERLKMRFRPEPVTKLMEGLWSDAIAADISAGGIRMSVSANADLKLGDVIDVEFPVSGVKVIKASCKVTRIPSPGSIMFNRKSFGIQFVRIGTADRDIISRHIRKKYMEAEAERRRMARVMLAEPIPIGYGLFGSSDRNRSGRICEMSAGGLRLLSTEASGLRIGDSISLAFDTTEGTTVNADGKIVHLSARSSDENAVQLLGVRYTQLESECKEEILRFLGQAGVCRSTLVKSA